MNWFVCHFNFFNCVKVIKIAFKVRSLFLESVDFPFQVISIFLLFQFNIEFIIKQFRNMLILGFQIFNNLFFNGIFLFAFFVKKKVQIIPELLMLIKSNCNENI